MKNKKIILSVSILFLSALCISNVPTMPVNDANSGNLKSQNFATADAPKREVISYVDVLRTYYNLATENVENPSVDFNAFYDDYYAPGSNRDLYAFTLKLATDNGNFESVCTKLNIQDYELSTSFSSSGSSKDKDQYYIFKSTADPEETPKESFNDFIPWSYIYDYSSIKNGDIIYETKTEMFDVGHDAIIDNRDHKSEYGPYIHTIEAVLSGVKFGFLDDNRMTAFQCIILRVVKATDTNVSSAIYFAREQLGKPYFINPFKMNLSINAPFWYCSLLVFAAYGYSGIDICVQKDKKGNDVHIKDRCFPSDIEKSYNTSHVLVPRADYDFMGLDVVKKEGNVWTIRIHNRSSVDLPVLYNRKMCFDNDARTWHNLIDVKEVKIKKYSHTDVHIQENWFATSIAVSYVKGFERIITSADKLRKDPPFLREYRNVIKRNIIKI